MTYNQDNYRYVVSAVVQSLAAILALLLSSSLLLLQLAAQNSPRSARYFPKRQLLGLTIAMLALLVVDGLALMYLPSEPSNGVVTLVNTILLLNAASAVAVVKYVLSVTAWMQPDNTIHTLRKMSKKATTNAQRLNVLHVLEELAMASIQRGYTKTVDTIIRAYPEIIWTYSRTRRRARDAATGKDAPFEYLPGSLSRIGIALCRSYMVGQTYALANCFADLIAVDARIGGDVLNVEIVMGIRALFREYIAQHIGDESSSFFANLAMRARKDVEADSVAWCLSAVLEEAIDNNDMEVAASALEWLIYSCTVEGKARHLDSSMKSIVSDAINKTKSAVHLHGRKGYLGDDTIGEMLSTLISIYDQSA